MTSARARSKLRELLPDRIVAEHPELYVGDPTLLSPASAIARLTPEAKLARPSALASHALFSSVLGRAPNKEW